MSTIFELTRIAMAQCLKNWYNDEREHSMVSFNKSEVQGCVAAPEEVSTDDFIEENKWSFGGGYRTIVDGYYINDDGTKGEYVPDT